MFIPITTQYKHRSQLNFQTRTHHTRTQPRHAPTTPPQIENKIRKKRCTKNKRLTLPFHINNWLYHTNKILAICEMGNTDLSHAILNIYYRNSIVVGFLHVSYVILVKKLQYLSIRKQHTLVLNLGKLQQKMFKILLLVIK